MVFKVIRKNLAIRLLVNNSKNRTGVLLIKMRSQNIWTKNIVAIHTRRGIKKKKMDSFGWPVVWRRLLHGLNSCIVQVVNISLEKLAFFPSQVNNEPRRHTCATPTGRRYIFSQVAPCACNRLP